MYNDIRTQHEKEFGEWCVLIVVEDSEEEPFAPYTVERFYKYDDAACYCAWCFHGGLLCGVRHCSELVDLFPF